MAVRKLRPMTPGPETELLLYFEEITTSSPEKSLTKSTAKRSGGRNNSGKMTVRYIGGGHKKKYRVVDFKENKHGCSCNSEDCRI